ncbi:hypothetical protein CASFOL_018788 [Castilleja foliolosa]|uniref:Uncharacterized protein n=1 Tax=Castilleja foliolosa TaxID=1961234 RepID=A0ABD3D5L0_9LAMI
MARIISRNPSMIFFFVIVLFLALETQLSHSRQDKFIDSHKKLVTTNPKQYFVSNCNETPVTTSNTSNNTNGDNPGQSPGVGHGVGPSQRGHGAGHRGGHGHGAGHRGGHGAAPRP